MLMPKKDRQAIYEYLFKEGVMVAKKDPHCNRHPLIEKVPNLHVVKAMQSLTSRGYVKEQFAWRHYYWYLTNEGIQYLRDYLHLPPEIVPATLKRHPRPEGMGAGRGMGRGGMPGGPGGKMDDAGRDNYRRGGVGGGFDKTGDAGPGAMPMEFRGGYGRGAPPRRE